MTILITGANRGIGLALAKEFATAGETVIGTHRSTPVANAGIDWQQLDVTQPDQHAQLSSALDGQPIEVLICNAGVYLDRPDQLDEGYAPELWTKTFQANVLGPFLTVQTLLPNLRAAKTAKVAIISSQMGSNERAKGNSLIYRSSKAAATNLAKNLSVLLLEEGIPVGAYHPGWVRTDMGGPTASISETESVNGLHKRISALSLANTGCYESYDGETLPY